MVLNVCRQILRDPDDAEDAFQATFLALACKASTLRIGESLGPWLYTVANRLAARARADRRRRADRERSAESIPEPEPDRGGGPDREEIPRVVHEELGRLPERLRAPIVLCYLEGMTHDRAALQLRCPVGTVRSRLARARALLHGRIARRGLATSTAALGAVLTPNARASSVPPPVPKSLVRIAAQLAVGTAPIDGCGVPARVITLREGVLNVSRVKKLASSMAALAVIGIVSAVAGLSTFSASGQTGDAIGPGSVPNRGRDSSRKGHDPGLQTYVKSYYVGDLIISSRSGAGGRKGRPTAIDLDPVVELITSTVAKGTWTVHDEKEIPPKGEPVKHEPGSPRSETVGQITPFSLSISLILRHTGEVHGEVADLLRKLRRLVYSRENPGGVQAFDREMEGLGRTTTPVAPKPAVPGASDRTARIRQLLDEIRQEVERLPQDHD